MGTITIDHDIKAAAQWIAELHGLATTESVEKLIKLYSQVHFPDCPFEMKVTKVYSCQEEWSIVARTTITPGIVPYLSGFQAPLSSEEEQHLESNGCLFSVMLSSRTGRSSLLIGPARFVNHACIPNAKLTISGGMIQVLAIREVSANEEITIY